MDVSIIPQPNPPLRSPKRSTFVPLRDSIIEEDKPIDFSPDKRQSNRLSYARSSPVRRRSGKGSRREPLKSIQPRVAKRESMQSSRSKRYSKRSSGISSVASGLPVRLSGAGHGAGGFGPLGHGMQPYQHDSIFSSTTLAPMRHSMTPSIPEHYKRMTMRAVEPDESTISEADSLEAFVHSRAKHRNSSNPLFSAQISRRTSSGMRALERARSIRSRADTVSVSTFSDEFRQSIQGRPYSTALSVSEYGDENARFSQYQTLQAPSHLFPLAEGHGQSQSQLSLAQDYRGVISPLPRFWSETSLSSTQRRESGSYPMPPTRVKESSTVPQSSSMVSDLDVHLSRKASPQKATDYSAQEWQTINEPLEPPPPLKSASSRGLPVASSGELAFV
ncbi:uncharacterized protein N7477_001103 [Penicillium maclennaniae]|uniref:uncharacterized protein n=1 Tax=Penicillium maclennaniae TaxID=1343394 RepID=UPI0025419410|nr:uncharacterized protein N7477_001103 [Penicillium maclennaniae]KAJ5684758.1 hypothetical protein N7477_001103 [Penicillium maclennaniae]